MDVCCITGAIGASQSPKEFDAASVGENLNTVITSQQVPSVVTHYAELYIMADPRGFSGLFVA